MLPEKALTTNKPKAVALGKPATGQCLCGRVCFEIDTPARWAWHDHSLQSRRAHGAAYATYVGSWRKRFRITKGRLAGCGAAGAAVGAEHTRNIGWHAPDGQHG